MRSTSFLLTILFTSILKGQSINYKILSNDPPPTPRLSINTDIFNLDLMHHDLDGWSVNVGLWGHYEIVPERIGAQFVLRRSLFAFGSLGQKGFAPNKEVELGGYYIFSNKEKIINTKVSLKKEYGGNTYSTNYKGEGTYSYTVTETFIMIPTKKKKMWMGRGGFISKSHGNSLRYLGDDYILVNHPEFVKFSSVGAYLGISQRTLTSIFIDTEKYGVQYHSIGRDLYLDVLILSSNRFEDLSENDITDIVKTFTESSPIGFRIGYKLYQIDPRTKTGQRFGLSASFDGGYRPYTGIFLSAGIGMTLYKR